jgi:hypothetical protein
VIGVLQMTAKDGLTDDALNQKLLSLGHDQGLKSVCFVANYFGDVPQTVLRRRC